MHYLIALRLNLPLHRALVDQTGWCALVSDMDLSALELWRLHRGRADCENRIKELKYESFNPKDFGATEATLLTVMLAYKLMSLFRQEF